MIDIKINNDLFVVRNVWHDNDEDFYKEVMTLVLILSTMNAMKHENQCDLRLMNTFYIFKEDLTNLENALKNNKHLLSDSIRETKNLVRQIRRNIRNENKNNKKKSNGDR